MSGMAILILLVYFVPFLIANHRGHRNQVPIFFLNLLLGWTIVGWVGALIWASIANKDKTKKEGL